jgi:hypothetical protein
MPERRGQDDTYSFFLLDKKPIFDWDDFKPAPLNQVVEFYKKYVEPHFIRLYSVERSIQSKSRQKIEAIQLKNGIFIPVAPPEEGATPYVFPDPKSPGMVDEMEWAINKQVVVNSTASHTDLHKFSDFKVKEMNEVFEHLRITFSNWLNSSEEKEGAFRKSIEEIISNRDLPLFEKRKRIEIMIGPEVEKWFSEKDEDSPMQPSLLRVDCLLKEKEDCRGKCSWSTEQGKCLIHVSKELNEGGGSIPRILLLRLIEELLRFGNRRREIFEQRISKLAVLDDAILQGDQYIVPEKSVAWTELLNQEWRARSSETPLYLEEMRREPTEQEQKPLAEATEITALPKTLETLFGIEDQKTSRLRIYPSPTETFEPFLIPFNTSMSAVGMVPGSSELSDDALTILSRRGRVPVVQYDLRVDPPVITGRQLIRDLDMGYAIFVIQKGKRPSMVVTDTEHPGFLKHSELPKAFIELLTKSGTIKKIWTRDGR